MRATGCGTGSSSRCCTTPACGSARRSGSGTRTVAAAGAGGHGRAAGRTRTAPAPSPAGRTIPVSAELIRLYADYLHDEYGDLDSDYVFVNLWGEPRGHALTYPAVYDLVRRLRARPGWTSTRTGSAYRGHPVAARRPVEVVSKLLGHASVTTTLDVYGHLSGEDARRALRRRAGSPRGGCRL